MTMIEDNKGPITVLGLMLTITVAVLYLDGPCRSYNQPRQERLIAAHEECKANANCLYEAADILKYERRKRKLEQCDE